MYIGHVGIALALRADRAAPPLWLLVLAAQGPDWGDSVAEALRWHGDPARGPHGLVLVGVGCVAAALVAAALCAGHGRALRAALIGMAAYASHWVADLLTGAKPTWPGGPTLGLGWYGMPARDLALESAVILVGWLLWRGSLPAARRRGGGPALAWALLAALLALQTAADLVMSRSGILG